MLKWGLLAGPKKIVDLTKKIVDTTNFLVYLCWHEKINQ